MLLNKKILIFAIVFLFILPVSYAQICEIGKIKETLRKILYIYYTEGNTTSMTSDEVKDMLIFYLSLGSENLTADCSALGAYSKRAIYEMMNLAEKLPDKIPACPDGTKYGECSAKRPAYCYAGALYNKCDFCGCPINSVCGKAGKCDALGQNITCFKDVDCGQNNFIGEYSCTNNYIIRSYYNYTCLNPGTTSSKCVITNNSVFLTYCNPNLNQICNTGKSTCQTTVNDSAPTVAIIVNPTTVAQGQFFNVTVIGTDDIGLTAIWWWAANSTDAELNKAHWFSCNGLKYCSYSWLVSTNATGTITLGANSRDTSYPISGQAHQASEGAGIAYATLTVTSGSADGVTLHSLTIANNNLKVVYSKNFLTCVHLLAEPYSITHSQNFYCTQGNLIEVTQPLSSFTSSVQVGQKLKLCHGNNYNICSQLVTVTGANATNTTNATSFDTLTIKGRYVNKFTGNPLANIMLRLVKSPSETLGDYYTNSNGDFSITMSTADITQSISKVIFHFANCYISDNGILIGRYPTTGYLTDFPNYPANSIYVWVNTFDLSKTGKYFAVSSSELNVGDVPLWPSTDIAVSSDIPVQMSIEYPEEGRGGGNILYKTYHYLSNVVPLSYDARVKLTDSSANIYYSPYKNYGLENGCAPVSLAFSNKQFSWSGAQTLTNQTNVSNQTTCVDYDNGDDIYTASYAKKGTQAQYDKCGTAGQNYDIIEGVCTNDQLSGIPHSCPTGTKCQDIRYEPAVYANVSACVNVTTTQTTNQTNATQCTKKLIDFEDDPSVGSNLGWNPDYGSEPQDVITHRQWLNSKGIDITGTPNGFVWSTGLSGPVGKTGVVIGFASPNHLEYEGLSDNEVLTINLLNNAKAMSAEVGLTVVPSNVQAINNVPSTIIIDALDSNGNVVATSTTTFTGVTNSVYTPQKISVASSQSNIAKFSLRATQNPYGGVYIEDVSYC